MKTLAERLRHLRMQKNMNQSQLARLAGIKPQIVQLIEAGKVLQSKHLFAIAHVLETSAEWLLTGSHGGAAFSNAIQISKNGIKLARMEDKSHPSRIAQSAHINTPDNVPIYSSSGNQKNKQFSLDTEQTIGYIGAHPRQQRMHGAFAFYCVGDAMAPRYEHGDLIYCLPNQPFREGDDVLITLMDQRQAVMGRLVKYDQGAQKLTFEQFNTTGRQHFNLKEVIEVYLIVGRG